MLTTILAAIIPGGFAAAMILLPAFREMVIVVVRSIPAKGWLAIGGVLLIAAAFFWHLRSVDRARDEAYAAAVVDRDQAWAGAFDAMQAKAQTYKAGFLDVSRREAAKLREQSDETLRRNAAFAADLRLHGPGRAAAPGCRSERGGDDSAAADRPLAPGGPGDAPLAPVPDDERLALVPWTGATRFAEEHDRYRDERNTLILHIDTQNGLIEELRDRLMKLVPEFPAQPSQ